MYLGKNAQIIYNVLLLTFQKLPFLCRFSDLLSNDLLSQFSQLFHQLKNPFLTLIFELFKNILSSLAAHKLFSQFLLLSRIIIELFPKSMDDMPVYKSSF